MEIKDKDTVLNGNLKFRKKAHVDQDALNKLTEQGIKIYDSKGNLVTGAGTKTSGTQATTTGSTMKTNLPVTGSTSGNIGSEKITHENPTGSIQQPKNAFTTTVSVNNSSKYEGLLPKTSRNTSPKQTERKGSRIKNNILNVLTKNTNDPGIKHIFDDIDDDTIENNISVAQESILTNLKRGTLNKNKLSKLPYMLDGMTMFYAAADKNKSKAAQKARTAAYTEDYNESLQKYDKFPSLENFFNQENTKAAQNIKYSNFSKDTPDVKQLAYSNYNTDTESKISTLNNPLKETASANSQSADYGSSKQSSSARYVGDNRVRLRSAPGLNSDVLGYMDEGTEVQFTGNKTKEIDGHLWAEVEYDGKKGWVAADFLRITNPNAQASAPAGSQPASDASSPEAGTAIAGSSENAPISVSNTPATNASDNTGNTESNLPKPVPRYVSDDSVRFRSAPGLNSDILGSMKKGTEVKYTGNKTEEIDGHLWAEVEYDGKKGWVAADYLRISNPEEPIFKSENLESANKSYTNDKTTTSSSYLEKLDLSDHSGLQTAFQNFKISDTAISGDFDGWYGLQCVDLTNWFINNYTTLGKTSGNGCDKVSRIANLKDDLEVSIIPSAPSVFSIAPGKPGPGVANTSDPNYGHTGIVLDVKIVNIPPGSTDPSEYTYAVTYFHTYSSLSKTGQNSSITTKNFIPNDGVTYVNIGNYLK